MDERNPTPNITGALKHMGAGRVQHRLCGSVWIFCPSTVWNSEAEVPNGRGGCQPFLFRQSERRLPSSGVIDSEDCLGTVHMYLCMYVCMYLCMSVMYVMYVWYGM